MVEAYMGIDVGSVSTNIAIIDVNHNVLDSLYIRTMGKPIEAIQEGIGTVGSRIDPAIVIRGVGTTGSARTLSQTMVVADVAKTEITAHAVASSAYMPDVRTILEIGGQDSKIIIMENGIVTDFAMNTVCAAGTGSFLDHQAHRLELRIEEFGDLALQAKTRINIAGRCTVFAESDMIHKQQTGQGKPEIIRGLCDALVRNFLNNICKGKRLDPPIMFQGGVAANKGIRKAFEEELGMKVHVPEHFDVMGAIGAAILAHEEIMRTGRATTFRGFEIMDFDYKTRSFECKDCPNRCEIVEVLMNDKLIARWGSRCGKWDMDGE